MTSLISNFGEQSCVDGKVRNYDLRMGCINEDYIGQSIGCVTFSHDENCILIATLDSKLKLFDKSNGQLLNE
jgi:mitogen-activated protein kinase organizer 1